MLPCTFCGTQQDISPCTRCVASLNQELLTGKASDQLWTTSLPYSGCSVSARWRYFGGVRAAILAFKVEQKWGVGIALVEEFLSDKRLMKLIDWADGAMPVPSSLWSRSRGRFDLAAVLAWRLAHLHGLRYWDPPRALWGAWKKQALKSARERGEPSFWRVCAKKSGHHQLWDPTFLKQKFCRSPRVLLIDDVVTSGRTLVNFATHFEGIELQSCCLAAALKSLTGDD